MANPRHNPIKHRGGASNDQSGGTYKPFKESTAAWPGVPGSTQRKDRSGGTKKVKQSVKSEGI
jgi:hypothetical protein